MFDDLTCRDCGCTDKEACVDRDFGACWWIEADLCSHCVLRRRITRWALAAAVLGAGLGCAVLAVLFRVGVVHV